MREVEIREKSLEEAITKASVELGLTSDKIDYVIIEKEKKGFLGLGSKECIIKAWEKDESKTNTDSKDNSTQVRTSSRQQCTDEEIESYVPKAEEFLKKVFSYFDKDINIESNIKDQRLRLNVSGDGVGTLIGKKGQTLDSIEYLTNLVVNSQDRDKFVRVSVDIDNYRSRRIETLENLAVNMAKKAIRTNKKVFLSPMNPAERRIIHTTLQDFEHVTTKSQGEEPRRKVVILPED